MKPLLKPLYIFLGFICLALSIVGAFLPILPTTPLALLAAYLFSKGSPRMHAWILKTPIAGPAIDEWNTYKVISVKSKITAVLLISFSLFLIWTKPTIPLPIQIFASSTLVGVSVFILTRKSQKIEISRGVKKVSP